MNAPKTVKVVSRAVLSTTPRMVCHARPCVIVRIARAGSKVIFSSMNHYSSIFGGVSRLRIFEPLIIPSIMSARYAKMSLTYDDQAGIRDCNGSFFALGKRTTKLLHAISRGHISRAYERLSWRSAHSSSSNSIPLDAGGLRHRRLDARQSQLAALATVGAFGQTRGSRPTSAAMPTVELPVCGAEDVQDEVVQQSQQPGPDEADDPGFHVGQPVGEDGEDAHDRKAVVMRDLAALEQGPSELESSFTWYMYRVALMPSIANNASDVEVCSLEVPTYLGGICFHAEASDRADPFPTSAHAVASSSSFVVLAVSERSRHAMPGTPQWPMPPRRGMKWRGLRRGFTSLGLPVIGVAAAGLTLRTSRMVKNRLADTQAVTTCRGAVERKTRATAAVYRVSRCETWTPSASGTATRDEGVADNLLTAW
nr:hypothetical protein CFP56_10250 [Quercus suber]